MVVSRVATRSSGEHFTEVLAIEEPLEIRVSFARDGKRTHRPISITMRTPDHDAELAAGFLFTEGIVTSRDQIDGIRHCAPKLAKGRGSLGFETPHGSNTIRVDLAAGVDIDLERLERHFYTSSSCGVCGKSSIEALRTGVRELQTNGMSISRDIILSLPDRLRAAQDAFEQTGGLHASALFRPNGEIDTTREDVGRHNALDKVIGAKFLSGEVPLRDSILLVSGRASFELVQKALMAGISIMAAVGAPSSLAVELAAEYGMTLVGFVRDGRFNVYCGEQRIV